MRFWSRLPIFLISSESYLETCSDTLQQEKGAQKTSYQTLVRGQLNCFEKPVGLRCSRHRQAVQTCIGDACDVAAFDSRGVVPSLASRGP